MTPTFNHSSITCLKISGELLTLVLLASCLVEDGAGEQLFRFLSPNTGRAVLHRVVKAWKTSRDRINQFILPMSSAVVPSL